MSTGKPKVEFTCVHRLAHSAACCCLLGAVLFAIALVLDKWVVSRQDPSASLGLYSLCYEVQNEAGPAAECTYVLWDCRARRCSFAQEVVDGSQPACQSWNIFEPDSFAFIPAPPSGASLATFASPQLQFPGSGECGAYDTIRVFTLVAFLTCVVVVLLLICSVSAPCVKTARKESPLLLCVAGILACFSCLLFSISAVIFLLDVYNHHFSSLSYSFILTVVVSIILFAAIILIVAAAYIHADGVAEQASGGWPDPSDVTSYNVGGRIVYTLRPENRMVEERNATLGNKRKENRRLAPRMESMGGTGSMYSSKGMNGMQLKDSTTHVTTEPTADHIEWKLDQLPSVQTWSIGGVPLEARHGRLCKVTRFGQL